ncbi:MAG: aminoglycoside 6-adenylyltransferase [Spirochaetes bacterium]|nr:aminoglycoside 6-adenylyltransferase [Spirochaetota bacterium]
MRTKSEVLSQFKAYANQESNISAAVLTSSQADPNAKRDFLSDYDIELLVLDTKPFLKNDNWLNDLGNIMVRWPYHPRSTFDENRITRLILFDDGVRIDFQITDQIKLIPSFYDCGYEVLINKNNILKNLPQPTHRQYHVKKPAQGEYEVLVNEFWWDATYVPKYLWRDELPFAKSMIGSSLHDQYLSTVINWYIGLENNWQVNTGVKGRFFKKFLSSDIWREYESTFAGSNLEDNWQAFFQLVKLFSKLGSYVGEQLGYPYPHAMEKEMNQFYRMIYQRKKG